MRNGFGAGAAFLAAAVFFLSGLGCTTESDVPDTGMDAASDSGPDAGGDAGDKSAYIAGLIDKDRYAADLSVISVSREPGSEGWKMVQGLIAERLQSMGFEVERHVYYSGTNIIGVKKGRLADAKEVMISAHYDHVAGCAGADDNASGVAGVLEVARVLSGYEYDKTLVAAFWDEEEKYLIGSRAYAERAAKRKEAIEVSIVFEMIGYSSALENSQTMPTGFDYMFPEQCKWLVDHAYKGDFILFTGDNLARGAIGDMTAFAAGIGLPAVVIELNKEQKKDPLMYALRRSDHESFWQFNYPAIMITDTADQRNVNYHCRKGPDSVDRLNHDFAASVLKITAAAAARALVVK